MADALARLAAATTADTPHAVAAATEAVWWITAVDAAMTRHHPQVYRRDLAALDPADFIQPQPAGDGSAPATARTWHPVSSPRARMPVRHVIRDRRVRPPCHNHPHPSRGISRQQPRRRCAHAARCHTLVLIKPVHYQNQPPAPRAGEAVHLRRPPNSLAPMRRVRNLALIASLPAPRDAPASKILDQVCRPRPRVINVFTTCLLARHGSQSAEGRYSP